MIVSIRRGARTASRTIGTAIAIVKVPEEIPEPAAAVEIGALVERTAVTDVDDDIEELVDVF